jgi:NADH-quinone oxidoreductase subunit F
VNDALDERGEDVLAEVLRRHPVLPASLIPVLQDLNGALGYLSETTLRRVGEALRVPAAQVYHVATFYKALSLKPRGRHVVKICMGTACHVRGAPRILDELCRSLKTTPGEMTADGEFSLETVNCLGACALGPVVVIDGRFYNAAPGSIEGLLKDFLEGKAEPLAAADDGDALTAAERERVAAAGISVTVCGGTGCQAYGCQAVASALAAQLASLGLNDGVEFVQTGCHGFCEQGPIVVVRPADILYRKVTVADVPEIIRSTVVKGETVERLLYRTADGQTVAKEGDIPFYAHQRRLILGNNGHISPESIADYMRKCEGYTALRKALAMDPESVVQEVTRSGLRGRGGGGFPTGRKWATCRKAHGEPKYVICNADEGDPGAYMDRSLLEGNPHGVLEGMIIGAHAIGASAGYVYVRDEYPLAVKHIRLAIQQAREKGFLGENILGSGLNFDVTVVRGGGAFVCGESTALMASLEGKVGEPRAKYVHTVESGLNQKPSNLNNVETWANVPVIINRGADWYAEIGTEGSKGTKIFSLVGKVVNTGLVEVPLGVNLREVVFDIGGGIPGGRKFKAVQTGGPSGGCLPEALLDLPVDFDALTSAGSMMGSGGMIVMDEDSCMVDVARYFLHFLMDESCGKCVPCREGVRQMCAILTRITRGEGQTGDIELLEEIAAAVTDGSLCALGGSAPNPVLSTLRYFRDEYEAHIREKRCPAGVCTALVTYAIDPVKCTGCTVCARKCPVKAISGKRKKTHGIDQAICIKCGVCREACRFDAVVRT